MASSSVKVGDRQGERSARGYNESMALIPSERGDGYVQTRRRTWHQNEYLDILRREMGCWLDGFFVVALLCPFTTIFALACFGFTTRQGRWRSVLLVSALFTTACWGLLFYFVNRQSAGVPAETLRQMRESSRP